MSNKLLAYIESQITHHGNQLEKYMLGKAVVLEAMKKGELSETGETVPGPVKKRKTSGIAPTHPDVLARTAREREAIITFLDRNGSGRIADLVNAAYPDKDRIKAQRDAIYNRVYAMVRKGQVEMRNGRFYLPKPARVEEVAA
jgi:hypothetical protein